MKLGLDFDNTIIDYSKVFPELAYENGFLSKGSAFSKEDVKKQIIQKFGDDINWQKLQALAYGPEIHRASLYDGVMDFLNFAENKKIELVIISHKTKVSYLDKKTPLQENARKWIQNKLGKIRVVFEEEKDLKIQKIVEESPNAYIDDLTDILLHSEFPIGEVVPVLFQSEGNTCKDNTCKGDNTDASLCIVSNWFEIRKLAETLLEAGGRRSIQKRVAEVFAKNLGNKRTSESFRIISKSGNNHVFRIPGTGEVLKLYSDSQSEARSRGENEFRALKLLEKMQCDKIPHARAYYKNADAGVYEDLNASPIVIDDKRKVAEGVLPQVFAFISDLWDTSRKAEFKDAPWAIGARMKTEDYLGSVNNRKTEVLEGLESQKIPSTILNFINKEVIPFHEKTVKGFKPFPEVLVNQLILSPSDFGLHNILEDNSGKIYFIDFEFFGWDDPVKLVCDFFHAPTSASEWNLVPKEPFISMVERLESRFLTYPGFRSRVLEALPVIGLEWVWIILGVFSNRHKNRKMLSDSGEIDEDIVFQRLERARVKLGKIQQEEFR